MGYGVHARLRDGKLVYRLWSSFSDQYISKEITKKEAHDWLLKERLNSVKENFEKYDFPRSIQQAEATGSSSMIGKGPGLDAPWDEPIKQPEPD